MEDMVTDDGPPNETTALKLSNPPPPGTSTPEQTETDILREFSKFESFNPTTCSWPTFAERFQNHLELYDVPTDKRVRILIDCISNTAYEKLRELCEPVAPLNKTFEELLEILDKQFNPFSNMFKERVKFTRRVQRAQEGVLKYATELKKWAKNCKFPESWFQEALFTQFTNGVRSEFLRTKLYELEESDFDEVVNFAVNIESMQATVKAAADNATAVAKLANDVKKAPTKEAKPSDVDELDESSTKGVVCFTCFQPGHKSSACKYKKQKAPATKKNLPNKNVKKNQLTNQSKNQFKNQSGNQFKFQNKNQFKNQSKPQFRKKPFYNYENQFGNQYGDDLTDVLRYQYKDLHANEYSNQNNKNRTVSSTYEPNNSLFYRR